MINLNSNALEYLTLHKAQKYKKTTLAMAIILIICSVFCLVLPLYAGVVLSFIAGLLFMICGCCSLFGFFVFIKESRNSALSLLLFGILYLVMGYSFVQSPLVGMNIMSWMIGFLFIVGGVSRLGTAFKNKEMRGRCWFILIGCLDLMLAFIWLSANEYVSFIITTTLIGLEMLFCGWVFLTWSYRLTKTDQRISTI